MSKVITALANPFLNNKFKEDKQIKVLSNDIQYQDGIFECFEKNKNIDYIVLSQLLPGNLDIKELIQKIQQKNNTIKIIIILEKENEELENLLYSKGVFKIFYNNKVEINEIISLVKDEIYLNDNEKIIKEIESLKKILIKNNIQINNNDCGLLNNNSNEVSESNNTKSNFIDFIKKYNIRISIFNKKMTNKNSENITENRLKNKKIISLLGTGGSRQKHCYC